MKVKASRLIAVIKMKTLKSALMGAKQVALSTLVIAGSFAYQKPAHATDPNLPILVYTYAQNKSALDLAAGLCVVSGNVCIPDFTAVFNKAIAFAGIISILENYTQAVSQNRSYCPVALDNYAYILNYTGTSLGEIINYPNFAEQRRLTTNSCS